METNFEMFDKFNEMYNIEELQGDSSPVEYVEVPKGDYEVAITKLELGQSKAGLPQVKIWFKVIAGEYKGQLIFMNQNVTQSFQLRIVRNLLEKLGTGHDLSFVNYKQYAILLRDIFVSIDGTAEFQLSYGENDKGFNTYEIVKRFDLN